MTGKRAYHHGDLRQALLTAAAELIAEVGPSGISLRELARRAGVSHAAPTHHFKDKAGLFTALAADGYRRLADALRDGPDELGELGVRYVTFAVTHPAHFEVMFRADLCHQDDVELTDAKELAVAPLREQVPGEERAGVLAAWSLAHGFATLWLAGNVRDTDPDPATVFRRIATRLNPSGR